MVDVSEPALLAAYEDVRSDKTETNWALFGYDDSGKKLQVTATGSGNISELVGHLRDDAVQYGFIAVITGDSESVRKKFVFLSWGGPSASVMKKAKISVHKADVKKVVRDFAVEVHGTEKADFDEQVILATVRKAGGADYGTGHRE
eukprot:TRINITY_DN484_c0_g1_i1.p1 TRINITY_DN484_c0_g1~~TRINITY_DN484_c0_g1_i1.p1  ORF type:complete len:146 (-),score=49.36 TRINITY_DN484_c0_g1_i1:98-535(-)